MILSTHAIVGAAIASFLPSHPTTAFVLGFASHFVLDAIPQVCRGGPESWCASDI